MMDIIVYLLQWYIILLMKKLLAKQLKMNFYSNKDLAGVLQKSVIKKFEKRKYTTF